MSLRLRVGIIAVVAFVSSVAAAQRPTFELDDATQKAEAEGYLALIGRAANALSAMTYECNSCQLTTMELKESDESQIACRDSWLDFIRSAQAKGKSTVDINMTFGYFDDDFSGAAYDTIQRDSVVEKITASCTDRTQTAPNIRACGFVRSTNRNEPDAYYKDIPHPHPGPGESPNIRIRLLLTASSVSTSDRANRTVLKVAQEQATRNAEQAFYGGLQNAEASIYVGHARCGGGPDFGPARRKANGTIDCDWYKRQRESGTTDQYFTRFKRELKEAETKSKIIGVFGCYTDDLFGPMISQNAPQSSYVATSNTRSDVLLMKAYTLVDSILWFRCIDGMNNALSSTRRVCFEWDANPRACKGFDVKPDFMRGHFLKKTR